MVSTATHTIESRMDYHKIYNKIKYLKTHTYEGFA